MLQMLQIPRKILSFDSIYFYFREQGKFGSIMHRDEKLLATKRRAQKIYSFIYRLWCSIRVGLECGLYGRFL